MNKTFQSFVFGCRVNEAERIRFDNELREAGFTVDLNNPGYLVINTCAITGKAEREAKQLMYSLRKTYPTAKIVLTGCSATYWLKHAKAHAGLADIVISNAQKKDVASILLANTPAEADTVSREGASDPIQDKFRHSNRLLVKIQDGCHRFCNYCIVPYLRGNPQSQKISEVVSYINSFNPTPSEVTLSAINTESFGKDTGETLVELIQEVLRQTTVPRISFGSIHPWSLNDEFIDYYQKTLSKEPRFVQFFHVPLQSGSQPMLNLMRREYILSSILDKLRNLTLINPNVLIATDIIVGYLGETEELFDETYQTLDASVVSRFHVFPFSNRAHTAAYYLKRRTEEPSPNAKRERARKLRKLSEVKYAKFKKSQIGRTSRALVIESSEKGTRLLLDNNMELQTEEKALPGDIVHVTIED